MTDEEPSQSETSAAERTPGGDSAPRRRQWIALGALLILVAVGIWQVVANYDFWADAWARGELFPPSPEEQWKRTRRQVDWGETSIPPERILSGGVPKDGIPALTDPKFVPAAEADFLEPDDRVIGVESDGVARAYPLAVLNHHEIVNDRVGQSPVAVTYCPLCDSAAVFDRRTELGEREFGVSGLLYNSNVLMYDRGGKRESLWSQLKSEGVTGPAVHLPLQSLPMELTSWKDWHARHPETTVLSFDTGHDRDYTKNPYSGYLDSGNLMFPVKPEDERLGNHERVLGVWTPDGARAYPISAFAGTATQLDEQLGDATFTVLFDPEAGSLRIEDASDGVQWMYAFWFAWAAFRPETEIYQ